MAKPLIFTVTAAWDDEAAVWTGHCDDIPAAADAPTLDELLAKSSAMTGVDPTSVYVQRERGIFAPITKLFHSCPAVPIS
jgi:hypothetical protein